MALVSSGAAARPNTLTVTGAGTTFLLERNLAKSGGALYVLSTSGGANTVVVEQGATLTLKNNSATVGNGGGASLSGAGTNVTLAGEASQVIIESNTAESSGGGVYAEAKARVSVESGATFIVENNSATSVTLGFGGGLCLRDEGTALTTSGNGAAMVISGNMAEISGAGLLSIWVPTCWSKVERRSSLRTTRPQAMLRRRTFKARVRPSRPPATARAPLSRAIRQEKEEAVRSHRLRHMLVESGAALVVQNNTATSRVEAAYLQNEVRPYATGNSTRVIVEQYGWRKRRRCVLIVCATCWSKAGGARRSEQHGHLYGGGVYLQSRSTFTPPQQHASLSRAIRLEKQEAVCTQCLVPTRWSKATSSFRTTRLQADTEAACTFKAGFDLPATGNSTRGTVEQYGRKRRRR